MRKSRRSPGPCHPGHPVRTSVRRGSRIQAAGIPAFSKWNDIKVTQDCRHLLTVSIFDPAHFIVQVASLKSKLLPQRQCVIQSLFRPSSIWCVLFRSALDSLDRNTSLREAKISSLSSIIFSIQFFYTPISSITPFAEQLQHSNSQNYFIIFLYKRQEISNDFGRAFLII